MGGKGKPSMSATMNDVSAQRSVEKNHTQQQQQQQ